MMFICDFGISVGIIEAPMLMCPRQTEIMLRHSVLWDLVIWFNVELIILSLWPAFALRTPFLLGAIPLGQGPTILHSLSILSEKRSWHQWPIFTGTSRSTTNYGFTMEDYVFLVIKPQVFFSAIWTNQTH